MTPKELFGSYVKASRPNKKTKRCDDKRHPGHILKSMDVLPESSREYVSDWSYPMWRELLPRYRVAFAVGIFTGMPTGEVGVACQREIKICDNLERNTWSIISASGIRQSARLIRKKIPGAKADMAELGFIIKFPSKQMQTALKVVKARARKDAPP